jgi:hypothetical protein
MRAGVIQVEIKVTDRPTVGQPMSEMSLSWYRVSCGAHDQV